VAGGGEKRVQQQHGKGKLTARERIEVNRKQMILGCPRPAYICGQNTKKAPPAFCSFPLVYFLVD
jgi:hypothetical protein